MSFFSAQNPGIGGLDELTDSEEAFLVSLVNQSYSEGDILFHDGSGFVRLPIGSSGEVLKVDTGVPVWGTGSGGDFFADGTVPMTGDLNMGNNEITDVSRIMVDDNVGIGTASPAEALHVDGTARIDGTTATTTDKNVRQVILNEGGDELLVHQTEYWNGTSFVATNGYGLGQDALQNNMGQRSNGFGHLALQNNTGANANGFGFYALRYNEGDDSNGFGYYALRDNTGDFSNGFGYYTLRNNEGDFSNGFGNYALENNTGDYSNGFGYLALRYNTGDYSNGFGYLALQNNTGHRSNGFGYLALENNTGDYSNGFGFYALRYNEGDNNTAIGYLAGYDPTAITGDDNTFLGSGSTYDTSGGISTITNATAVGANITLTDSNTVILGDNANVGIGTTSPTLALEVDGGIRSTDNATGGGYFELVSGSGSRMVPTFWAVSEDSSFGMRFISEPQDGAQTSFSAGGVVFETRGISSGVAFSFDNGYQNPLMTVHTDGNVGIGTTSPDTKLDVAGAVTQRPLSSDPTDPDAGNSVQWVSDGTGSGDAGDVMMKINVAGTTKTVTLIDFSTLT